MIFEENVRPCPLSRQRKETNETDIYQIHVLFVLIFVIHFCIRIRKDRPPELEKVNVQHERPIDTGRENTVLPARSTCNHRETEECNEKNDLKNKHAHVFDCILRMLVSHHGTQNNIHSVFFFPVYPLILFAEKRGSRGKT
jgi:hypothetical protein